jgi:hypothetical protein
LRALGEKQGEWRSERWEGASKARGREQLHREALESVNGVASAEMREQSQRARQLHREALEYRGVSSTVKLTVSKTELLGSNPSAPARVRNKQQAAAAFRKCSIGSKGTVPRRSA